MKKGGLYGALWLAILLLFLGRESLLGQTSFDIDLPDAPQPQCLLSQQASLHLDLEDQSTNPPRKKTNPGFPPFTPAPPGRAPVPAGSRSGIPGSEAVCVPAASSLAEKRMCCDATMNPFTRFIDYTANSPLTSQDKLALFWRNIRDPYNLLTIGAVSAISVAADSHNADGPGIKGFAKNAGVSLTQEATSEFFTTFLIAALAHQDPRYHRWPNLPLKRRILHVFEQVVISQSDDGQPMFNYATVFGTIGSSALGNLYVPGRKKSWGASATRISVSLATDPIGNAISEFVPDVARRINVNVVLVQRLINRIAVIEGGAPQ
ncbi:MAG TPA: hypothetical protein VGM27_20830 [Acidobacteriaceae bacterium]